MTQQNTTPYPHMLRIIAPLALAAVTCFSCRLDARSQLKPIPGPAHLVLATYNVNFGLARDAATLAAIRAINADVVMLQETSWMWERAIRAGLGKKYPHMVFHHNSKWPAGGLAFLSRYPLEGLRLSKSRIGFFPAWRVVVRTPAGPVQLVNVHLKPPVSRSGSYVSGYFVTPKERAAEMKGHLALVKPGLPTIVAGDFNEQSGGGLGVLSKRRMISALPRFAPSATTWRWPVGSMTLRQRLDHIVHDPTRVVCLGARVLKVGRSDHYPVVARFRLVKAKAEGRRGGEGKSRGKGSYGSLYFDSHFQAVTASR